MDKACFCPPKGSRDWGGVGCKLKLCQCRNVAPQTGVAKPDPCHTTLHFKLVWQSPHKPHHFRRQWPRGEGEGGGVGRASRGRLYCRNEPLGGENSGSYFQHKGPKCLRLVSMVVLSINCVLFHEKAFVFTL